MPKQKTVFICTECGFESPRWLGKCPDCGGWSTLVEEAAPPPGRAAAPGPEPGPALPLTEVPTKDAPRRLIGIPELDRVLGGGLVKGSLVLVGGDPGIGKSTLLLQAAACLARDGARVLYISGEESARQVRLRADRLGAVHGDILISGQTRLPAIEQQIDRVKPDVVVMDSIQTVLNPALSSAPGSVSQVREGASFFMNLAKRDEISVFLVGHVNKEGALAGPRVLEHMVDTVLYFEGERYHAHRALRAVKNRFGSTNEVGLFAMGEDGMRGVDNPSELLLSERSRGEAGSVVMASMEGTRPMLVEVQSLLAPTSYGNPRRTANGVDLNRMVMLIAVLEKKAGLALYNQDAYLNVVGGLRLTEPAADLAVAAALASSLRNAPIGETAVFGEVGLTGEVRAVGHGDKRIAECVRMGFSRCVLPRDNLKALRDRPAIELIGVERVREILNLL